MERVSPASRRRLLNKVGLNLSNRDVFEKLGLKRYCCRRMLISHVDLIEKLLNYEGRHQIRVSEAARVVGHSHSRTTNLKK